MRKLIASLLLSLALGSATPKPHYAYLTRPQFQVMFADQDVPQLPDVSLDAKDLVRILSSYNVEQVKSENFCSEDYGRTNFARSYIEICTYADPALKQLILLHEVYHVRYHEIGLDTSAPPFDLQIRQHALAKYLELFGPPSPAPPSNPPTPPQN